jgi:hypothetical protein
LKGCFNHKEFGPVKEIEPAEMFFDMPALDDFPTAFQGCVHNFRVGINKLVFDEHLTDGIVDELVDG